MDVSASLRELPGVGAVRAERLERMGLRTIRDLLLLVPHRLESTEDRCSIADAHGAIGRRVRVRGTVAQCTLRRGPGRRSLLRVRLSDGTASIDALFFNQPWMRGHLTVGQDVELEGRVVDTRGAALVSPRVGRSESPLPPSGELRPVYPTTEGIGQELLRKLCAHAAQEYAAGLVEELPVGSLEKHGLLPLPEAIRQLHGPAEIGAFESARRRVALEALLVLQARLVARRKARLQAGAPRLHVGDSDDRRIRAAFPFVLTEGQERMVADIRADLARGSPMRRLLQGDVGSGKTAVGIYACAAAAACGYQAAFLAPTELLAEQHLAGAGALLERAGVRTALLTGSRPPETRRRVLAALAEGEIQVVFGTHALFSEGVVYRRLGLAVIDEQHRFGVAQRRKLLEKGSGVHVLLMTATPIPRTLALTVYGDLDVGLLREKPPGRGTIATHRVPPKRRARAEAFVLARVADGQRAYWVCPRIDSGPGGLGAEELHARIAAGPFAPYGVELVHGRLPADERAERLDRFRKGESRCLVGTTVIEVGVDVPEATVMIVEGAERFGLAQLHQLRGRVGRGGMDSWCLLFGARSAEERLLLLEKESDGFALAEEDLRQRGMGELGGLRQAGASAEGLAAERDVGLLLLARDLVQEDPAVARLYLDRAAASVEAAGSVPRP